jgi:hypothetical protein
MPGGLRVRRAFSYAKWADHSAKRRARYRVRVTVLGFAELGL